MTADDLAQLGARVETAGSTGARTSREILDSGRSGLAFFRDFGPAYATMTGADFDFERDFARPYDGADHFSFAVLRADQERFTAIGEGLENVAVNLRNRGAAVFGAWQGSTADAAQARFGDLLTAADDLRGRFTRLSQAVAEVIETADRACYAKAAGVAKLHTTSVDRRTPEDVTFLVDVAPGLRSGEASDAEFARAVRVSEVVVPPSLRRTPAGRTLVSSAVDTWLTSTFAPEYEWRARRFTEVCATADRELAQAMATLDTALTEVGDAGPHSAPAGPAATPAEQHTAAAQSSAPAAPTPPPPDPASHTASPTTDHPPAGGPDQAGAGQGSTQPEPLAPGEGTDVMAPQGFRAPAPTAPVAPTAGPATGNVGGTGFVGGVPFFPATGATGGGDRTRQPLNLTTGPGMFDDFAVTEGPSAIGADDDPANYNEEATERADQESKEDPFDDVW